ncbi:hypothetical protein [Dyella amyloliquefaciens]|uniref:hypothetical protein n=1 Tax=Dyella amyloliquefaciens TaxID=1770545 RepID=UPI00102EB594|nr:hypothetical protein [Dyella amyloliquefaciens]
MAAKEQSRSAKSKPADTAPGSNPLVSTDALVEVEFGNVVDQNHVTWGVISNMQGAVPGYTTLQHYINAGYRIDKIVPSTYPTTAAQSIGPRFALVSLKLD